MLIDMMLLVGVGPKGRLEVFNVRRVRLLGFNVVFAA